MMTMFTVGLSKTQKKKFAEIEPMSLRPTEILTGTVASGVAASVSVLGAEDGLGSAFGSWRAVA